MNIEIKLKDDGYCKKNGEMCPLLNINNIEIYSFHHCKFIYFTDVNINAKEIVRPQVCIDKHGR